MTDLEVFNFPVTGQFVRSFLRNDEPWFIGRDACAVLAIAKPETSLALLDEDEKDTHTVGTPGGPQAVTVINESGLYSLILRSRRPEAKAFKRWITHDVLPAIRKTGQYGALDSNPRHEIPQNFAEALRLAADEHEARTLAEAKVAELEPKAEQADHFRSADGLIPVADFANSLAGWAKREHDVRIKHRQVWDFLGDIGLLIRGETLRKNHPTSFATQRDLVRVKRTTYETNTQGDQTGVTPRLTPAGEGYAWDRAVKRIASHGSLSPVTDLEPIRS